MAKYPDAKIFGQYLGRRPLYVVVDPSIVKTMTIKHFSKFTNRLLGDSLPLSKYFRHAVSLLENEKWKVSKI